jgi:hypothetical protein
MNNPFGFARKWGGLGQERGDIVFAARGVHPPHSGKKVGKADRAHAHAATVQEIAPRQREVLWIGCMVVHAIKALTMRMSIEFNLPPLRKKLPYPQRLSSSKSK